MSEKDFELIEKMREGLKTTQVVLINKAVKYFGSLSIQEGKRVSTHEVSRNFGGVECVLYHHHNIDKFLYVEEGDFVVVIFKNGKSKELIECSDNLISAIVAYFKTLKHHLFGEKEVIVKVITSVCLTGDGIDKIKEKFEGMNLFSEEGYAAKAKVEGLVSVIDRNTYADYTEQYKKA